MLPALLASLQLSTKDGKAKLELQFGRPDGFQPGFAAAGHPAGAPNRCRPRSHRGRASKEWSRWRRAALFQASLAAATHGAAPASAQVVDQNQEASNPPGKARGDDAVRLCRVKSGCPHHRRGGADGQQQLSPFKPVYKA